MALDNNYRTENAGGFKRVRVMAQVAGGANATVAGADFGDITDELGDNLQAVLIASQVLSPTKQVDTTYNGVQAFVEPHLDGTMGIWLRTSGPATVAIADNAWIALDFLVPESVTSD